jgi:hypothetical protein
MLRRAVLFSLLAALLAAPAHAADKVQLLPGVTYEQGVQFTPHGAVAFHVVTAPRPGSQNGLYALAPAIARGTVVGGRSRLTQLEKDVSGTATVVGINGDFSNANDSHPTGIYMEGGVLKHPPSAGRSSLGIDTAGTLHVDRVRFFGTWRGTGQRRPLNGLNEVPKAGEVVLFTPAWGLSTPRVEGAAEVVLQPFPQSTPNTDLTAPVTAATATGGGTAIPPDGAVLMAAGTLAPKLQAEAPVGTPITTRLILQPEWAGVPDALGGGPVLVRAGKPVFRSLEDFTAEQLVPRGPRAGVGQLADGRIVMLAVDGASRGYSVGMSTFELAQTMVRLGAVTAVAVESGGAVTAAFDGRLLNRPSDVAGERAVKEALLVKYFGVYAPPAPERALTAAEAARPAQLSYKIVRPSKVTASLIGPDGVARPFEQAVDKQPGTYAFTGPALDLEGTWHWNVVAVDDLGRQTTVDRPLQADFTLSQLRVPGSARQKAGLTVGFSLSRAARVQLRIETRLGSTVRVLPAEQLPAGDGSLGWDGRLPKGTLAFPGPYVARVIATSSIGKMDLAAGFTLRK